MVVTITSRAFNQDASGAKRAASQGPVFITDRGRPGHVLLPVQADGVWLQWPNACGRDGYGTIGRWGMH